MPGKEDVLFEQPQHALIEGEDLLITASKDLNAYHQQISINLIFDNDRDCQPHRCKNSLSERSFVQCCVWQIVTLLQSCTWCSGDRVIECISVRISILRFRYHKTRLHRLKWIARLFYRVKQNIFDATKETLNTSESKFNEEDVDN